MRKRVKAKTATKKRKGVVTRLSPVLQRRVIELNQVSEVRGGPKSGDFVVVSAPGRNPSIGQIIGKNTVRATHTLVRVGLPPSTTDRNFIRNKESHFRMDADNISLKKIRIRSRKIRRGKLPRIVFTCVIGDSSNRVMVPAFRAFMKKRGLLSKVSIMAVGAKLNPEKIKGADIVVSAFFEPALKSNVAREIRDAIKEVAPEARTLKIHYRGMHGQKVDFEKTFEAILDKLGIKAEKKA
jgi:hypothetical protein